MATSLRNLPEPVKAPLRLFRKTLSALQYYGKQRHCPVCGKSSSHFGQYGVVPREDAKCFHCGSLERHRLTWLFIQKKTSLLSGGENRMLHVAPERCFKSILGKILGDHYLTADLARHRAMVEMDICDIQYPEQSFDVIYCSHVLEHVQDDRRAIREFFRVLKNGGWAILNVPITSEKTFEDTLVVDPEDRLKAFGQRNHVRRYGPDYVERLRESGFSVEVFRVEDLVSGAEAVKMGLTAASGEVYYCVK